MSRTPAGTTPATGVTPRVIHAPRGPQISCKGWQQEAAMRMLMNNLDPDVAEKPDELIVYGGGGKAVRPPRPRDARPRQIPECSRPRNHPFAEE